MNDLKKVTRVKFPTQADFESWKESNEQPIITIVELGTVKLPDTFDEEGNRIEGEIIEGYHVDFMSEDRIDSLNDYIVTPENPAHGSKWAEGCEIVRQIPTMDWLKVEIQDWLTANNIEWTTSLNKDELIDLV